MFHILYLDENSHVAGLYLLSSALNNNFPLWKYHIVQTTRKWKTEVVQTIICIYTFKSVTCGVIVSQFGEHCFSSGVLLATWLLHLLYYMCPTWWFHVDVATVGYRLTAKQMRFYLWPVQSIHGKNKLIEQIVLRFCFYSTCDTILTISLCVRVFFNETKAALFFEVNSPETN